MPRLTARQPWTWSLLGLLLVSCRTGGIAGQGARCDEQTPCRTGYLCRDFYCRSETPAADATADARANREGTPDRPAEKSLEPPADLDAGDDASSPDGSGDGPAAAEFPSLIRCSEYGHPQEFVRDVLFSPDGTLLATVTASRLRLWNVAGPTLTPTKTEFVADGHVLAFSPDGALVATMGREVNVWRLATGAKELTFTMKPNTMYRAFVEFGRDSQQLLVSAEAQLLDILPLSPGGRRRELPFAMSGSAGNGAAGSGGPWWIAGSMPGTSVVIGARGARVGLVDLNAEPPDPIVVDRVQTENAIPRVALSRDTNFLAVAAKEGAQLWDVSDKPTPRRTGIILRQAEHSDDYVSGMEFFPSGKYIVVAAGFWQPVQNGNVTIHSVATGKAVTGRDLADIPVRPRLSPDGRGLAIAHRLAPRFLYCRD